MEENEIEAWVLDAAAHAQGILLWLKQRSGAVVSAVCPYHPVFYAVLAARNLREHTFLHETADVQYSRLCTLLGDHPHVASVTLCQKRVDTSKPDPVNVIRIEVDSPFQFKKVVCYVRELEQFDLYNTDLPLVQMWFYDTGIFPVARCRFKLASLKPAKSFSRSQAPQRLTPHYRVISFELAESNEDIHYELPPLRVVWLDLDVAKSGLKAARTDRLIACRITPDPCSVPIAFDRNFPPEMIGTDVHGQPQLVIQEAEESETILGLQDAIQKIDPDILFTVHGDEELFPYLLARASYLKLDRSFTLSRDNTSLRSTRFQVNGADAFMSYGIILHRAQSQFYLNGRLHIDSAIYGGLHFDDGNLYGIVEVARVSYTPLQRLTRITIGGSLQSLQFFHANKLGILIPEEKKNAEYFQQSSALLLSDRGGHILQPKIGFFDRVAEMDFTSMYPSLMCRYNISPDTLNCACCKDTGYKVPGLSYHFCSKRQGIVPLALKVPLTKRIQYKHMAKSCKGPESQKYKKMEEALKWILVVCFGYLGFRNARFGRIECHQSVCAYAREFLLNAMEVVEAHGFSEVHGIVDCLWVQAPATVSDEAFDQHCIQIAQEISDKTQIPLGYDPAGDRYETICFLPTKADPVIGALNRYWGKKVTGGFKIRGLELRRHDAPAFIKQFQEEIMAAIGNSPYRHDSDRLLRATILPVLTRYYEYLESGKAKPTELALNIHITRRPNEYKVHNYQAIAAAYLERLGAGVSPGQGVSFVITNDRAENPQERVMPLALYEFTSRSYDVRKYKELLVRAVTNMLPFALSPSVKKKLQSVSIQEYRIHPRVQRSLTSFLP